MPCRGDIVNISAGHAITLPGIDLGLTRPPAQRLCPEAEPRRDGLARNRHVRVLIKMVQHQPRRTLLRLLRNPLRHDQYCPSRLKKKRHQTGDGSPCRPPSPAHRRAATRPGSARYRGARFGRTPSFRAHRSRRRCTAGSVQRTDQSRSRRRRSPRRRSAPCSLTSRLQCHGRPATPKCHQESAEVPASFFFLAHVCAVVRTRSLRVAAHGGTTPSQ
jgi:hypothetical protein